MRSPVPRLSRKNRLIQTSRQLFMGIREQAAHLDIRRIARVAHCLIAQASSANSVLVGKRKDGGDGVGVRGS